MEEQKKEIDKINEEYANLAAQAGHKAHMIHNTVEELEKHTRITKEVIDKHQREVTNHYIDMRKLREKANKLQEEIAKAPKEVISEEKTA